MFFFAQNRCHAYVVGKPLLRWKSLENHWNPSTFALERIEGNQTYLALLAFTRIPLDNMDHYLTKMTKSVKSSIRHSGKADHDDGGTVGTSSGATLTFPVSSFIKTIENDAT